MRDNTFFIVEERHAVTGRTFAHAEKVANCNNLLGFSDLALILTLYQSTLATRGQQRRTSQTTGTKPLNKWEDMLFLNKSRPAQNLKRNERRQA